MGIVKSMRNIFMHTNRVDLVDIVENSVLVVSKTTPYIATCLHMYQEDEVSPIELLKRSGDGHKIVSYYTPNQCLHALDDEFEDNIYFLPEDILVVTYTSEILNNTSSVDKLVDGYKKRDLFLRIQ